MSFLPGGKIEQPVHAIDEVNIHEPAMVVHDFRSLRPSFSGVAPLVVFTAVSFGFCDFKFHPVAIAKITDKCFSQKLRGYIQYIA